VNSYYYGRREFHRAREENRTPVSSFLSLAAIAFVVYVAGKRLHLRPHQLIEGGIYLICSFAAWVSTLGHFWTLKRRRQDTWPHPAIHVPMLKDSAHVRKAFSENSIVLGYDVHKRPWFWRDDVRRMQALLLGQSGSGKTTLMSDVVSQDLRRVVVAREGRRRIPMIIFDGKGDQEFLEELLYEVAEAGRSHQLRILDPLRPEISVRYNPLYVTGDSYQEHVNFIFESFGLRRDFFKGHQAAYFSDLVRVLVYTGKLFNIYDVLVLAMDPQVLKEQIRESRYQIEHRPGTSAQHRLNFEMSVRNLYQSLEDRERVPKIQGLLNELMTFLEDEMSIIIGSYDELLTLDDVIEQELILFISLNVNRNTRAVTALGRMLLQNLQLVIGRRYQYRRDDSPFVSIILDEFAPFAYANFAQILQTARGTNTAILFSLQSIPQLLKVSPGFCHDVSSAPNTVMLLRTRDEETARYFQNASSLVEARRLTMTVEEKGILEKKYAEIGFGSETRIKETRAQDQHIKNLPVGQFELLMTDNRLGTLHSHLHVRRPPKIRLGTFAPVIYPPMTASRGDVTGANLRFKDPEMVERRSRLSGRKIQERWQ
jgi:hypothetical protein